MSDLILKKDDLKVKLDLITSQIADYRNKIVALEDERKHLEYFFDHFDQIATHHALPAGESASLFPLYTYDSTLPTKELILAILKKENRKMTWREIYDIFHAVKPAIAEITVRVGLSAMNKSEKYPVKLIQKGEEYHYVLEDGKNV